MRQLAAVLAVGGRVLWPAADVTLLTVLPAALQPRVLQVAALLAQRPGPIVPLPAFDPVEAGVPLERLVVERSVSINAAAAGGNASLMTIG